MFFTQILNFSTQEFLTTTCLSVAFVQEQGADKKVQCRGFKPIY